MRTIELVNGSAKLRLGGKLYASGGWLEEGTPISVMWVNHTTAIDQEGELLEFIRLPGEGDKFAHIAAGPHPWETSGNWYTCGIYRRTGEVIFLAGLPAQAVEFVGGDPEIALPVESYYVFGSGSLDVNVKGALPEGTVVDFGHNGFWGTRGVVCRLSEIPPETAVWTSASPGGDKSVVRAA